MADPAGVNVAFDDNWAAASPAWTRIDTLAGCRVRGWEINRGRPDEFSKTDTGTAAIHVVDLQGIFDPTNATSPYLGKITPGKQACISLWNPASSDWHIMFRGFIESWRYRLDKTRKFMELELGLVDGFAILSRFELRVGVDGALPPYTGTPEAAKLAELAKGNVLYGETAGVVRDRILAVLDDVGYPPALYVNDVDIFSGNVRVGPKAYGPGTSALAVLEDAADAEFPGVANLFMAKDGHVRFRGRQARFRPDVAEYGIQRRTVGDDSAILADGTGLVVPLSELEWTSGQDNIFNSASATPQGVGTGASWRTWDPSGHTTDDITAQYVQDDVSVGAYGLRSITFDNLQTVAGLATGNNSQQETKTFADYYVSNYKDPHPRVNRMVFRSDRPGSPNGAALWRHLCNCEISDLLTLKTQHPGGGGFSTQQFYVEGIHYTCRAGNPNFAIVELSLDVSPQAHWTTNPWSGDHTGP